MHSWISKPVGVALCTSCRWLVAVGVSCGLAVSVKWTALATPAMVALESALAVFGFLSKPVEIPYLLVIAFSALTVCVP
jgi:dolichyl-phosphate-mannose--protein O-mannosyl transferase